MTSKPKKALVTDEVVSQYLIENPGFFVRNAKQIENMHIPHPIRGVISLSEWQLARQRNKIKQLESEITLLMEQASANEKLFESLMLLQNQLLSADNLNDMVGRLNIWAKSLGLVGAYLYLFDDKWQLGAPSSYQHLALSADKFEFIRVRHLQYTAQYLGQLNSTESHLLVPENVYIGSVALSLLGKFGDLGILMFVSRNPYHYQTGQGTLLLEKISEMVPLLISRWITRKP
ncbi:DUF484 domain-containing protein [Orbus hercynius]|uniref:DUF484 domain-containing protein n=1 Tax=Orbus hercynius TaxID=593135 RepID=UPI00319DC59E